MVKFIKYFLSGTAIGSTMYIYQFISDSKEIAFLLVILIGAWVFSIIDDIDRDTE